MNGPGSMNTIKKNKEMTSTSYHTQKASHRDCGIQNKRQNNKASENNMEKYFQVFEDRESFF